MDLRDKAANPKRISKRRMQQPDLQKRESDSVFNEKLPRLLLKPISKWTKAELLKAIERYFSKTRGGMLDSWFYFQLEAKLKNEPFEIYSSEPQRQRGRPPRYPKDVYLMQWESTQQLRRQIAEERRVKIDKVSYKVVARRRAEDVFKGRNTPDFKIRELADMYEQHSKVLNKKKKTGEI